VPHHTTTDIEREPEDVDDVPEALTDDEPGATCEGGLIRLGAPDTAETREPAGRSRR
jgi:hypothetical protein